MGCMPHMMNVVDCCLSCLAFSEGQNAFLRPLCIGLDANKDGRLVVEFQRHKSAEVFMNMRSKSIRKKKVTAAVTSSQKVFLEVPRVLCKSEHDLKNTRWMNLSRGHFVDMAVKHWDDHGLWHEQWWKCPWFHFHRQWSMVINPSVRIYKAYPPGN